MGDEPLGMATARCDQCSHTQAVAVERIAGVVHMHLDLSGFRDHQCTDNLDAPTDD